MLHSGGFSARRQNSVFFGGPLRGKLRLSEIPMSRRAPVFLSLALLLCPARTSFLSAQPNHTKAVWNYDGGLLMMTDGSIPSGPCFRFTGRATAPDYFENLKREDSQLGTIIHRG